MSASAAKNSAKPKNFAADVSSGTKQTLAKQVEVIRLQGASVVVCQSIEENYQAAAFLHFQMGSGSFHFILCGYLTGHACSATPNSSPA
jgi:hypothetical protein